MIGLGLVALGGATGACLRYLLGVAWVAALGSTRAYVSTAAINVAGSFAMGALIGWLAFKGAGPATDRLRLLLATGVLGGFTTFSSFSLEAILLVERRAYATAAAYVGGSVAMALLGLFAGLALSRRAFA
ncbi:MAG: CrcB family protein [Caulobacteraceae bacterium]|nr:CrcB family protein [Caulobacter sp.]